jgi:antitoxin component YwqK of YwqJK toxin-antitoxin module
MPNQPDNPRRPNWKLLLLPLALCVAFGLTLLSSLRPVRKPTVLLPELVRTNLVRLDGLWCETGHTNPFTGVLLDYYPNGVLQSRSVVSNGLLNGLSEGWHTNGLLQIREFYHANLSDGLRMKWYPDGKKLSESNIVFGKMQGIFRRWYDNGKLAEEIPMRDGKIEGVGRAFYPSGFLKTELEMHNGEVSQSKSWEDGQQSAVSR